MSSLSNQDILENITIEPMTYWDLEQVAAIERASFKRPWQPGGFRAEMERKPSICLIARHGPIVYGYLIFWLITPEIHILNIAVKPDIRRMGLGKLMLNYLIEYAKEVGVTEIFLEVRPSNKGAMQLYENAGFETTGVRKNYYAEDKEDALLMTLHL